MFGILKGGLICCVKRRKHLDQQGKKNVNFDKKWKKEAYCVTLHVD